MKLTQQQAQAFINEMEAQGLRAEITTDLLRIGTGYAYGVISRIQHTRRATRIAVANVSTEYTHTYTDNTGATHEEAHDSRKTLAHEYTHILQTRAGYYERGVRGSNENARKAYNEIVANTIGMLAFPNRQTIIDNASYINNYIADAQPLMHHLKEDIKEFLPQVNALLVKIGLK